MACIEPGLARAQRPPQCDEGLPRVAYQRVVAAHLEPHATNVALWAERSLTDTNRSVKRFEALQHTRGRIVSFGRCAMPYECRINRAIYGRAMKAVASEDC